MNLAGKVALVTGAGQGFGWGIANALARAGARVVVNDLRADETERAVAHMEAAGGEAMAAPFDVADRRAFDAAVKAALERWGRVDILVHAAIYMPLTPFEGLDDSEWQRQLDVGLGGLYHGAKAVWPAMVRQGGGHIITIASGSSVRGYTEEVAYCTIKHGVEGFTKALALEAEGRAIAVNTMGPGAPIKPTRMDWEELRALPRSITDAWADPVELGRAFVWLASQPPERYSGLRFDAGPLVATLDREGADFPFDAAKVTAYPDDLRERQRWRASYPRTIATAAGE
jgi:NAD(P)-dependent dehydrogenase (short-subunit alcohol dehydrogenase family)